MASCDSARRTRSGKRKLAAVSNERVKNKDKEENMQLVDTPDRSESSEKNQMPEKAKSIGKPTSKQSKSTKAQKSRKLSKSSNLHKTPKDVKDFFTRSNSVGPIGFTSSIIILNSNQILIADFFLKNVKVINTQQDRVISELELPGAWDIARVSGKFAMEIESESDEFAVTTDDNKTIQFVDVSDDAIVIGRHIEVEGNARGIAYNDKNQTLIVSLLNQLQLLTFLNPSNLSPSKFQILTLEGTIIRNIGNERTNVHGPDGWLFTCPEFVIMNRDRTGFYVSDSSNGSVTLMTLEGQVKEVYKDSGLLNPRGLVLHKTGFLYVAECSSHTIFKLEPENSKFEPILENSHELLCPIGIAYCDQDDAMYVGRSNNKIKVFKMK